MNKKLAKVLSAASLALLLTGVVGCGDSGGGDTPTPPPTPSSKTVEINFWHTFGQSIIEELSTKDKELINKVCNKLSKLNEYNNKSNKSNPDSFNELC